MKKIDKLIFFLSRCLKATSEAKKYLVSDSDVTIKQIDNYYVFIPKNIKRGLIFYPGAKIENIAYAPLLYHFAKYTNTLCALITAKRNLPILSVNSANQPIEQYSKIKEWYVGGHSLGGVAASSYASKHLNRIHGVIFLSSYTATDLKNMNLKIVSIYGDQDLVLNKKHYEERKDLLPKIYEKIIQGGNHSGFAMYGEQPLDGAATISKIEQIKKTVEFCHSTILR